MRHQNTEEPTCETSDPYAFSKQSEQKGVRMRPRKARENVFQRALRQAAETASQRQATLLMALTAQVAQLTAQ